MGAAVPAGNQKHVMTQHDPGAARMLAAPLRVAPCGLVSAADLIAALLAHQNAYRKRRHLRRAALSIVADAVNLGYVQATRHHFGIKRQSPTWACDWAGVHALLFGPAATRLRPGALPGARRLLLAHAAQRLAQLPEKACADSS